MNFLLGSPIFRCYVGFKEATPPPTPRLWQPRTLLGAAWCATCNASTSASESEAPLGQSSTANDTIFAGGKMFETKKIRKPGKRAAWLFLLKQMGFCLFLFLRKIWKMEKLENCHSWFSSCCQWKIQRLDGSKKRTSCITNVCQDGLQAHSMVLIQNKVQQTIVAFLFPWSVKGWVDEL